MTVSVETNKNRYIAAGPFIFQYTFKIQLDTDLTVITQDLDGVKTTHTLGDDYTVTGVGNETGGNVVFTVAPTLNHIVLLWGTYDFKQEIDYEDNESFPAQTHEDGMDKTAMVNIRQKDEIDRGIGIPPTDPTNINVELPPVASRANKYLAFDSDGNVITTIGNTASTSWLFIETDEVRARSSSGLRLEDDGNNLGIFIADGGKVSLANGTGINEFSTDGTLAGDSDDAVPTEKAVKTYVDANAVAPSYVKVSDVKSSGSGGGTFTQDAWQTRVLNTEDSDTAGICTLSDSQITLDAGTYECKIIASAHQVIYHKAKLRNVTDSADLLIGSSEYSGNTGLVSSHSFVVGKFTIAASKALEVQHRCTETDVNGYGFACNFGVDEVYTVAEFWKVG